MRMPNDLRLAREVQELDLVLGGHDHHYEMRQACCLGTGGVGMKAGVQANPRFGYGGEHPSKEYGGALCKLPHQSLPLCNF